MTHPHHDDAQQTEGPSRRTLVKGAAWSVPLIAAAAAAPLAVASTPPNYVITSAFGIGWYPTTQGQTTNGALQYDASSVDKYLIVNGTSAGDVVSNIYVDVLISTAWPAVTFSALPGSNPSWTTLANTGATEVVSGVTYRIYRTQYVGTVTGTAGSTNIPVDFYFRVSSPYYSGATAITRRYLTVNSTPVSVIRNPATINNTNVPLSDAPTP